MITSIGTLLDSAAVNCYIRSELALLSKANGPVSIFKTIEVVDKANQTLDFLNCLYARVYLLNTARFLNQAKIKVETSNAYLGNTSNKI